MQIQQFFNNWSAPPAGSNKWNIPPASHGLGEYSEQVSDESVEYLVFKQCILEKGRHLPSQISNKNI